MTKKAFGSLKAVPHDSLEEVEERNRWKSAKTDLPGKWPLNSRWQWSVFIPGIVFWGISPPQKKAYNSPPQTACKLCAPNLFSARQWITNIAQELSFTGQLTQEIIVIKQSKGCKFMPKMHQNMFGGRWISWYASPDPPAAVGGLLLRGGTGEKGTESKGGLLISGGTERGLLPRETGGDENGAGENSRPMSRWVE